MNELPNEDFFDTVPDWVCEVEDNAGAETNGKLSICAEAGVQHAWLVDTVWKTVLAHALGPGVRWAPPAIYRGHGCVRIEPFGAIEIDLGTLWTP